MIGVVRIQRCLYMSAWVGSQGFVKEECSGMGLNAWVVVRCLRNCSCVKKVTMIPWHKCGSLTCWDWCWSWNSNTLATWCKELPHLKRPWCWERLRAGGEGDDRGWDRWMASPTQWTWVWVDSWRWWWTGSPGVLQFKGLQRVGHYGATELNWAITF